MRPCTTLARLVLASIIIGTLLSASCASSAPSPTASGTTASAAKPYGGLTVATAFVLGGLEPKMASQLTFQALGAAVFDSLVELTPDGQPKPGIAERWEISPDGKTHTFFIRKGVKFHDGSDLTGADVKFSMERILEPDSVHNDSATWRNMIASVDLKDDYTVALQLKQPQFLLLKSFADFGGGPAVVPKKYFTEKGQDAFGKNPVGSGPWKVLKWEPGVRLELEAVESHWRAVPKFKNVTLLNSPGEATTVAMLKTGELDFASIAPDSASQLKAAGIRIMSHDGASQYYLWPFWDLDHPDKYAFGDVRVRKAMSVAINRQELVDKLFVGYAVPSALYDAQPTAFFWDTNVLKADPYDPEGAKKLLAEAGYPNGFDTGAWDTGKGGIVSMLVAAIAGYWRKVGINTAIIPIEFVAANQAFKAGGLQAWNKVYSNLGTGGTFQFEKMAHGYHSKLGSPKNLRNPKLDELIEKVPLTADLNERKRLALEAAVMAKNEFSSIAVLDASTVYAIGSKIGEFKPIKGVAGLGASLETMTHAK